MVFIVECDLMAAGRRIMAMQKSGSGRSRQYGRAPAPHLKTTLAPPAPAGQYAGADAEPPLQQEYAFLLDGPLTRPGLAWAEAQAWTCGAAIHEVLLGAGLVSPASYAAALARHLGLRLLLWDAAIGFDVPGGVDDGLPARAGGRDLRVLVATDGSPDAVRRRAAALAARGLEVALVPSFVAEAALAARWRRQRLGQAVHGLAQRHPVDSAAGPIWLWQVVAAALATGLILGGLSVAPAATIMALSVMVAVPFLCIALLRLAALREVLRTRRQDNRTNGPAPLADHLLPRYSVLVPLLREAAVLPALVAALRRLDYPPARLEILLLLEAGDVETQAALLALDLPGNMRTVMVPDHAPRTKPKALNYALQFARGDFVVVYDAEDRPQPDQLRRAAAAFHDAPADLGCLQAQLNIYNPRQSWFTRQFTIEYSALFDAILPALVRLGLPVPLGGTSNHFRREALAATGGWDPFNVTEDADLGIRLARRGYRTAVLQSTTWEEAPCTFLPWLKQRTRWLKGWMQTYLVHTRQPVRLARELGLGGALGFHALMGGLILSALLHPLFYVLLAYHALSGQLLARADSTIGALCWLLACTNLAAGYLVSILVGIVSVRRRGRRGLARSALLMPVAWLLISLAAYRALIQLVRDPFGWEKTEHGASLVAARSTGMRLSAAARDNKRFAGGTG
ncbi:MAG TPA: glycosyltransferase [Hyphomicrobiaceae bacterium]|nr:glycosyltransferase [Hyphomicrobiaceae bacterium]